MTCDLPAHSRYRSLQTFGNLTDRRTGSQPTRDFLTLTQREREERTPPDGWSNPPLPRHQTTNGGMFFAKGTTDLMQRLTRLPTAPHIDLLFRGKPKPFPWLHKHHL